MYKPLLDGLADISNWVRGLNMWPAMRFWCLSHMYKPLLEALADISSRVRGLNSNRSLTLHLHKGLDKQKFSA